jgi:hypothetical protein
VRRSILTQFLAVALAEQAASTEAETRVALPTAQSVTISFRPLAEVTHPPRNPYLRERWRGERRGWA